MTNTAGLSLYQTRFCPYCERVRRTVAELGIELESRDINASSARRAELATATGRTTVPCLRIEGDDGSVEWMHESSDIIAFLETRFGT